MKTIKVKELMVPLADYATVSQEATLREAILALEEAQTTLDPTRHKHRAVLVLDDTGKVISKLTMKDILVAIEPNYGKVEGTDVLERSGYSPDLIRDMLEDNTLWVQPLQFICEQAAGLKLSNFIQPPSEDEYIDENATLAEATHRLVIYPYLSLLVTRGEEVVGILRLSDLFSKVCEIMKNC
jgi:CBS domain-containing protein